MRAAREEVGFEFVDGKRIAYVRHDPSSSTRNIVVMAHGFKSTKIGPSRYFVALSRMLAEAGLASFRFDQPGSGDSEGDFEESSFFEWTATIVRFGHRLASEGYRVALLGQSMGGAATMAATRELHGLLRGIVIWSAGPMLDAQTVVDGREWREEEGQRVRASFWQEAAQADFLGAYRALDVPAFMVFGTADHLISEREMRSVEAECKPGDRIDVVEGLGHSAWPYEWRTSIVADTAQFFARVLGG